MKNLIALFLMTAVAVCADPAIDKAVSDLNAYAHVQKSLKVQDPGLAFGMRKALVAANLLFDASGKLLLERREEVKAAFIPAAAEDYEVNMGKAIDQLSADWQAFFDTVTAPKDSLLVQALFSTETITDRHAKVAVLAALLAPYNQGPVGDCFAIAEAIRDHEEYYRHAAEDYRSLIMNGYVERPVDNSSDYFFYLPNLADGDLDQNIALNFPLFDAPGFAAARTLMGEDSIDHLEDAVLHALAGQDAVTPAQVIQAMAQVIASSGSGKSVDALAAIGEYGFSSLTNNPILRACEAAFAAMAEDRPADSTRSNVNSALKQTLQAFLSDAHFYDTFNNTYHFVYNLNIPLAQVSDDGSSTDGGFQLYKRSVRNTEMGTRVATPQDFRQLVLDALKTADIHEKSLLGFVNSDAFLQRVLWNYDPDNKKEPDPLHNYTKLSRTPMQSCDGDNNYEVDGIDTGTTFDSSVQTYTPNSSKDLLTWCLGLAKTAPAELVPMDTPQHAFNFAPANPDLAAFLKSCTPADRWIQSTLVTPGMRVAAMGVSPSTQSAVIQALLADGLPESSDLHTLAASLSNQKLNVTVFAQKLLQGLQRIYSSDDPNQLAVALDGALIQSLPADQQTILQRSAVRFALTNWNEGIEDIYFCAFFNPRTQSISFGNMLEDKTQLTPMDETAWVNQQQWDVDLTPFAPKT